MHRGEALLAHLRAVFRSELEDYLVNMERACVCLARHDAGHERWMEAMRAIFRAAHSLKGAARAVGYAQVENLCHGLENALAPVRAGHIPMDADAVRAETERAIKALNAWVEVNLVAAAAPAGEGDGMDDSTAAAPEDEPAHDQPPDRMEEHRSAADRRPQDGMARRQGPVPATAAAPAAMVAIAPAPEGNGAAVESVRVSTARIAELLGMSEDLMSTLTSAGQSPAVLSTLEDSVGELRWHLGALRRAIRGTPQALELTGVSAALKGALTASQTISAWALHQRRSRRGLWDSAVRQGQRVAAAARRLRVVAFQVLHPTLERAALDAARTLGKTVSLVLHGGELEIDREVLEHLRDPLCHLIRNAVDHGIESADERAARGKPPSGSIQIWVRAAGEEVVVVVKDDGAGLDRAAVRATAQARGMDVRPDATDNELLQILFEPGFTTRSTPTRISGRGVGLDVVRQRIAEMQGRIVVHHVAGRGMQIELTVPMDSSAMPAFLLDIRGIPFALAESTVVSLIRLTEDRVQVVEGREYLRMHDGLVPLADLANVLGLAHHGQRPQNDQARLCIVMAAGERCVAFKLDGVHPPRTMVIKPLGRRVRRAAFVSGISGLSGGELAPVLDALALISHAYPTVATAANVPSKPPPRLLVVDDSMTTRQLLRSLLEAAGYTVHVAPDGQSAWSHMLREAVDLVVSDIEMPHMDGFQLLARVRATAHTAHLPFILVTSLSRHIDRQRALDLGANAYVVKSSFDQEALLDTIEELLG